LEGERVDFGGVAFLDEETGLGLEVPETPGAVVRGGGEVLAQGVEVYVVYDVVVASEEERLLELVVRVEGPET
jgi:hypothetical protein